MDSLAEKIRNIRKNLGLSMQEFGQLFDPPASKGVVSNWENGYNKPNNERLKKIAQLGNTTSEDLLRSHKSEEEILYAEADPKKIGKLIYFTRLLWGQNYEEFSALVNSHLKHYNNSKKLTAEDLKNAENGLSMLTYDQLHTISQYAVINFKHFLQGKVVVHYDKDVIKATLKNLEIEINEEALTCLINALNETKIIKFDLSDIAQMYMTNLNHIRIYDKETLLEYLNERYDILSSIIKDNDNLSEDLIIDLTISCNEIARNIERIKLFDDIFNID